MVRCILTYCFLLLTLMGNAQGYEVAPLNTGLNGAVFSPAYFNDDIVVCSNQKDRLFKTVLDEQEAELVDLYVVGTDSVGSYVRFDELFRTDYNDGPITFSGNGELCVVSRNQKTDQKLKALQKEENVLGLYTSSYGSFGWTDLKALPFNSSDYNCSHPSLNEEGTQLVFASDMPGGYGGFDLWMCYYENGTWSEPQNLGEGINSDAHEVFPTQCGGILYFSSNRNGDTGLDIFATDQSWVTVPKELSEPINSEFDDFGLITQDGRSSGYFSSSRNGDDHIFSFYTTFPVFDQCDSMVKDVFCYTLYEQNAAELEEVSLIYEWSINDVKLQGVEVDYCFPGSGDYEISLDIIDTILNETYYNQASYAISLSHTVQPFINSPDTVWVGQPFGLDANSSHLPNMVVDEYYWEMGDGFRNTGSVMEHTYAQTGVYVVQLGVIGFEAEMEVRDCVYKTIVCVDESVHIANVTDNLLPDHENDSTVVKGSEFYYTDLNDSIQTVFSVEVLNSAVPLDPTDPIFESLEDYDVRLEYIEEQDKYLYVVGHWSDIAEAHPTWVEIKQLGFDEAIVRAFVLESIDSLPLNDLFALENIVFDSDKWEILPQSEAPINKVIELLKEFPDLSLQINAHTDATGGYDHNLQLSVNRANAVKQYIIGAGIDGDRLRTKGFGESDPIDTNETEEGKANNRRVEFILVKD